MRACVLGTSVCLRWRSARARKQRAPVGMGEFPRHLTRRSVRSRVQTLAELDALVPRDFRDTVMRHADRKGILVRVAPLEATSVRGGVRLSVRLSIDATSLEFAFTEANVRLRDVTYARGRYARIVARVALHSLLMSRAPRKVDEACQQACVRDAPPARSSVQKTPG